MKKEERLRKIIIVIAFIIALMGGYFVLTRENPIDEMIGNVIVTNGSERIYVDGYKYSYNKNKNSDKYDNFISITDAQNIPEINYFANDENNIAVSYSDNYTGDLSYTVYDNNFNVIVDHQPNLVMPGDAGKKYYIEIEVNWGELKKNVTVKYYFSINIENE